MICTGRICWRCIRWISSWCMILRSKSNLKDLVFFIIVWNPRLYLSVIFRNLFHSTWDLDLQKSFNEHYFFTKKNSRRIDNVKKLMKTCGSSSTSSHLIDNAQMKRLSYRVYLNQIMWMTQTHVQSSLRHRNTFSEACITTLFSSPLVHSILLLVPSTINSDDSTHWVGLASFIDSLLIFV